METIDVRGLSCPEPVLRVQNAVKAISSGSIKVLLDSPAARDNVKSYGESQGFKATVTESGDDYIIILEK